MRIIEADLSDDAQARAIAHLRHAEGDEGEGTRTDRDDVGAVGRLRSPMTGREFRYLMALAGDEPRSAVGVATVTWETVRGNDDAVSIDVFVAPEHRRTGIGTALLSRSLGLAPAAATRVWANIVTPGRLTAEQPARRWAEHRGLRVTSTAHDRFQDWPADAGLLDRLDPGVPDGYRLECHVDGVPEGLRDDVARLSGLVLAESPTGDRVVHAVERSADDYTGTLQQLLARGGRRIEAVAVADDGTLAGLASLEVPADPDAWIEVGGTLVLPEHRGRRLGMALKCAAERCALGLKLPQHLVWTNNDDANTHMIAINDALGFRPGPLVADLEGERELMRARLAEVGAS